MSKTAARPKRVLPTPAEATARLLAQPAIDMTDLAVLLGVSVATVQRRLSHEPEPDLPFPAARIGQRWVIPSVPVREFLHMDAARVSA